MLNYWPFSEHIMFCCIGLWYCLSIYWRRLLPFLYVPQPYLSGVSLKTQHKSQLLHQAFLLWLSSRFWHLQRLPLFQLSGSLAWLVNTSPGNRGTRDLVFHFLPRVHRLPFLWELYLDIPLGNHLSYTFNPFNFGRGTLGRGRHK